MLVLLAGVTGAGKNTIQRELIKRNENIVAIPSYTTREPRPGDVPGETYNFVTKEEFERMIKDGELYEYNIYNENYYGTSKKILNDKIREGKTIVKDIDVNGVENLVKLLKNDVKVVTIFLKVPREILINRLKNRIDKPSDETINARISRLEYEESKIGEYDYMIKNNSLEKTVQVIEQIIKSEYDIRDVEF